MLSLPHLTMPTTSFQPTDSPSSAGLENPIACPGTSPDPDVPVTISPSASWHDTGGELVLFHLETKAYFELNTVGAEIWRHLANGLLVPEIVARLAQRYDAGPATIAAEVRRVISELIQAGLLIPVAAPKAVRS